jgi:hypothetical protein
MPLRFLLSLCLVPLLAAAAESPMKLLPASDTRYRYEGRFDLADPAAPVTIWSGSRISVDFEGPGLALSFGQATGQNFFNVSVDGVTEIAAVPAGEARRYVWPRPLAPGRHHVEIFKRSEADAGHVAFRGIELAAGAQAWAPPSPAYRLRIEFLGDSITAGANNEDGAVDQWEDRRTHNHAFSYAYLTSRALGADHRAMAISGMGICEGFVPMLAGDTWDKLYPRDNPAKADLTTWVPDVVCVNFGENDSGFTRANSRPFPPGFTAGYVAFIKDVRRAYPQAQIVLLRGGMWGGANNEALRQAWEAAVQELEATDPRISHYVFRHWSEQHPRVADDRAMADELTAWLKRQEFLKKFL